MTPAEIDEMWTRCKLEHPTGAVRAFASRLQDDLFVVASEASLRAMNRMFARCPVEQIEAAETMSDVILEAIRARKDGGE